ncbi:MAG: hypothetical protein EOO59_02755, partial [Hymenobacter sp.]
KNTKSLTVDAFGAANSGAALGDVIQDMGVVGSTGYICVNNSARVQVVSLPSFKAVTTLRTPQPRYFAASATRGYVTAWRGSYTGYQAGTVLVIDLSKNTIIDSVKVGTNPERPAISGNLLYVPNSYDSTISVIDLGTNKVTSTVTVAPGPQTVVVDNSGNLWARCSRPYGSTATPAATLVRFAPGSTTPQLTLPFATSSSGHLAISPDRQTLYYNYAGAEYSLPITATALATTPFIRRSFNGFAIDPRDNTVFGAVSTGYSTNGYFLHYAAGGGTRLDSVGVRVGPNGFAFY